MSVRRHSKDSEPMPRDGVFAQALVQEQKGYLTAALAAYEEVSRRAPDQLGPELARARVLHRLGRATDALAVLKTADLRWPARARVSLLMAQIHLSTGALERADSLFRTAVDQGPDDSMVLFGTTQALSGRDVSGLGRLVRRLATDQPSNPFLQHALFRIEDDAGNLEPAFLALQQANRQFWARAPYDRVSTARLFTALRAQFGRASARFGPDNGPTPIFVVGLPRSGTSLVEAILSRHSEVTGMGELDILAQTIDTCRDQPAPRLGQSYLRALPSAPDTPFATDKMPLNFRFIGHIATSMPQARIVHVIRDPRAVAWSLYRTPIAGAANGFANDPAAIVRFHQQYGALMRFWARRFPGRVVTLDYEDLVTDAAGVTRSLLSDLGLAWDHACLSPHKTQMSVRTASAGQVRRPIYQGSRLDWQRYAPWTSGWLSQLGSSP